MAAWRLTRERAGRGARRGLAPSEWARLRTRAAAVVAVLAVGCGVAAAVTASAPDPVPVALDPDGTTEVPATHFFQPPWVLFAAIPDPRHVPSATELGCRAVGGLGTAAQPADMAAFGAHVVEGQPISAALLFGRSGEGAAVSCDGAQRFAPLWLWPSSEVPPFAPTAFVLLALLALAVAALVNPDTADLPARLRARLSRDRD